mgnify:CR=1 FL=1
MASDVLAVMVQTPEGACAKAETVLALPMHPYLAEADQAKIIEAIRAFNG